MSTRRLDPRAQAVPVYDGPNVAMPNGRALPHHKRAYWAILTALWEEQGPGAHLSDDEALLPRHKMPFKRTLHVDICATCRAVLSETETEQ